MTESVLWWSKLGRNGWLLLLPSGEIVPCKSVTFRSCRTQVNDEGFKELPGGPRGVVRGEVASYEPEEDEP